jgi:DNA-binding beta-propeller fold protein YncE
VYVSALDGNSITRFKRGRHGRLSSGGCIAYKGENGCKSAGHALRFADSAAVSPDGRSLYVTGFGAAISRFDRARDGTLAYAGCLGERKYFGCRTLREHSLAGLSIALSPDGRSLYLADGHFLIRFDRRASGRLVEAGCFSRFATPPCKGADPAMITGGPSALAISPDGSSLYLLAGSKGTLSQFSRTSHGQIAFRGCVAYASLHRACSVLPKGTLEDAKALAVSPDEARSMPSPAATSAR